jgi:hypothetical protein
MSVSSRLKSVLWIHLDENKYQFFPGYIFMDGLPSFDVYVMLDSKLNALTEVRIFRAS